MSEKGKEVFNYIALVLMMCGQFVIGFNFIIGQSLFVLADVVLIIRCFKGKLGTSEKIKNSIMTAFAIFAVLTNI